MILPRISHTEVIVLSRGCTCLRSALPLARARSAPTQQNLYSPTEFRTEHSCWVFSHRFHRFTQKFLLRKLPQISQNTQNFLAEKNSVKSVDSVEDIHALTSVRICEICGSFFNYKLRVDSVGSIHALTSVRICEICGSFFNHKLRVDSVGFFNYKLQKSECYRKLGTTLQRRGNDITGAR